jgi:hypothetical protein
VADFLATILSKVGNRLLSAGRRRALSSFPGAIRVADCLVTDLKPLGGYHQPGVTKAGRLSFAGLCQGHKVKVYSAFSKAQIELRLAVQNHSFPGCVFPQIIATDEHLVVEAWVEGDAVASLPSAQRLEASNAVSAFLLGNQTEPALLALASTHASAFCYLNDYLLVRLGVWRHWGEVGAFIEQWQGEYQALRLAEVIPHFLSHPDLSAANLIREHATGCWVIIDNELLGVGAGWVLDAQNSLLKCGGPLSRSDINVPQSFVEKTWRLRQLGSALDANDFVRAASLCRSH